MMRCGDIVRHKPTGEEWVVAWADHQTGYMAWAGWPDGQAKIADCEVVKAVTDPMHWKAVAAWVGVGSDRRPAQVKRLYPSAWARAIALAEREAGETI